MKLAINLLAALVITVPATFPVRRAEAGDADRYVWDLPSLYPDDAAWAAERAAVERGIAEVARLRGVVCRDARHLADALELVRQHCRDVR